MTALVTLGVLSLVGWGGLMKRFVEGLGHGHQSTLFPETLEEFVAEDNAIRLVEASK